MKSFRSLNMLALGQSPAADPESRFRVPVAASRPAESATSPFFPRLRVASASARRPASPSTSGARFSRTARTKSASSRRSGSSRSTGSAPPSIDGRAPSRRTSRQPSTSCARVVDRQVGVGLEEADLPHPLRLIRLAVTLAMQPDANRSRALAMSNFDVSTGTPTASIDVDLRPRPAPG